MTRKSTLSRRAKVGLLIGILAVSGAFASGILVAHYRLFPYGEIRSLRTQLRSPDTDVARSRADIEFDGNAFSALYELRLEMVGIPDDIYHHVSPQGSATPYVAAPYVAQQASGEFLGTLSSNIAWMDLDVPPETRSALLHFSVHGDVFEFNDWIDLTALDERLRHIKDLQAVGTSTLFATNAAIYEDCVTLQFWRFEVTTRPLSISDYSLIFETSPCLAGFSGRASNRVILHQAGGRIVVESPSSFLLSTGDFGLGRFLSPEGQTSTDRPPELAPPNTLGAVLRVFADGSHEVISTGHRNPQGLALDSATGRLWLTEHGPRGGDELNLIRPGKDYGWPEATYGVPYEAALPRGEWEIGVWGGRHLGFEEPILAWMASIAPSQIIVYRGAEFEGWNDDLLVSTLAGQSIRRIRIVADRVVFDEEIPIGQRLRDIVELQDGRLLLGIDGGSLGLLSLAREREE